MSEGLRIISHLPAPRRLIFLGQEAEIMLRTAEQPLEHCPRVLCRGP